MKTGNVYRRHGPRLLLIRNGECQESKSQQAISVTAGQCARQDRAHNGFGRPERHCLEVPAMLLITISTVLAMCDQREQQLRSPPGRALEARLVDAGHAFCNCPFSPVTARGSGVGQCVCHSSPLLVTVLHKKISSKALNMFLAG